MLMLMITDDGFYPIEGVHGIPVKQQAKDHGEINGNIRRVEDINGNVLWSREQ